MQNIVRKIQCQCGNLQGHLSSAASAQRLACHCQDCQAYAHALGKADRVLDEHGATDVVATLQQHVSFTKGAEALACLSLSDKGMLRWYASCCNTPIANTARDPKLSFVSLVHSSLAPSATSMNIRYGSKRVVVNPKHAKGKVSASAMDGLFATARIIGSVLRARANGSWKHSPFFRYGSDTPVAAPRVLNAEERSQAFTAVHPAA